MSNEPEYTEGRVYVSASVNTYLPARKYRHGLVTAHQVVRGMLVWSSEAVVAETFTTY
jgi:hypothetical protein